MQFISFGNFSEIQRLINFVLFLFGCFQLCHQASSFLFSPLSGCFLYTQPVHSLRDLCVCSPGLLFSREGARRNWHLTKHPGVPGWVIHLTL